MAEILKRHSMIYFANAGFDYYELWSQGLVQAASDRRIIDMLIRAPLKEIATIGYIRSYSLKDACKWHLLYEMNKHEEEGEASVRLNFRQNKEISDEEAHYLALDCVTTYLIGEVIGKQATEDTHTLGSIVLTHVRNNGMNVDEQMFSYCEGLLKKDMETYRQQLIQFGFPDPLKKKQKTEMEVLQEGWQSFICSYFQNFYDERYNIPFSIPCKNTCKRLILYGLNGIQNQQDRASLARLLTALLVDQKSALNKAEKEAWDSLTDEWDFLTPCDTSRKKEVWPILLKCFFDGFLRGLSYEEMKEAFDECIQDHSAWFAEEPEIKPTEFIQRKLKELEAAHQGLHFARTEKTGQLKCSKKDAWLLGDFGIKDPFLDAYNNFVHVQKYLSTYVNRAYVKADGKVHPRYGVVATMRTSSSSPNAKQLIFNNL